MAANQWLVYDLASLHVGPRTLVEKAIFYLVVVVFDQNMLPHESQMSFDGRLETKSLLSIAVGLLFHLPTTRDRSTYHGKISALKPDHWDVAYVHDLAAIPYQADIPTLKGWRHGL